MNQFGRVAVKKRKKERKEKISENLIRLPNK
jgi:hypothetical protein